MNEAQSRDFDLTVTQIRYVIHRETKPSWNLDSGRNDYFVSVKADPHSTSLVVVG